MKKIKNALCLLLIFMILMSMSGCSQKKEEGNKESQPAATESQKNLEISVEEEDVTASIDFNFGLM